MFGRDLYSVIWEYVSGLMYFGNIPCKYGKYIDGIDRDYFLWWTDNRNDVNSHA